jgi:hypothetical protein
MRKLIAFMMLFSISSFAQDAEQYKYDPSESDNPAEYYIGSFNKGKDLDDLIDWYGDFAEFAESKGSVYENMTVSILTPYFHNDLTTHDVMWVNTFPSQSEQFLGLETWVTGGGADLMKKLPITNTQVVNTWQWNISQPSTMGPGDSAYAIYSTCELEEGYNMRQVYDAYVDMAKYAQSVGDTIGRKMIVPTAGHSLPDGKDFVRLMYTASISSMGENAELFWEKIAESEAAQNLKGFSCSNANSYVGLIMR